MPVAAQRVQRHNLCWLARELTEPSKVGAGETVLLVEDEADVRTTAAEHLRDLGFAVLEAEDGATALRVLRSGQPVDLLVTDVGLPGGMNGRQVADAARERLPGLPTLFITGYAGNALKDQLAPGMDVMGKPFSLDALVARIRAMLDAASARSGPKPVPPKTAAGPADAEARFDA